MGRRGLRCVRGGKTAASLQGWLGGGRFSGLRCGRPAAFAEDDQEQDEDGGGESGRFRPELPPFDGFEFFAAQFRQLRLTLLTPLR